MPRLLRAAKEHWKQKVNRCPKRNAGGHASSRKKKANTVRLSDLPVAKARDASRFAESDEPALCEEDEEPDDPAVIEAEQDLLEEDRRRSVHTRSPTVTSSPRSRRARRSRSGL